MANLNMKGIRFFLTHPVHFTQPVRESSKHLPSPDASRLTSTDTRNKTCPLCQQANRAQFNHYLSKCPYLPANDRNYLSRARQVMTDNVDVPYPDPNSDTRPKSNSVCHTYRVRPTSRRVSTKRSPSLKVFYHHYALLPGLPDLLNKLAKKYYHNLSFLCF